MVNLISQYLNYRIFKWDIRCKRKGHHLKMDEERDIFVLFFVERICMFSVVQKIVASC